MQFEASFPERSKQCLRSRPSSDPAGDSTLAKFSTYRKLKLLNVVYQRAVRMAHAWQRWKRKDPHNRVSRRRIRSEDGRTIGYDRPTPRAEPPLCTVFSRKAQERRLRGQERVLASRTAFWTIRWRRTSLGSPRTTQRPERRAPGRGTVRPLHHTVGEIDALYEKARAWVEEQDIG